MSMIILGYGNLMRADDGVGVRVIQELERQEFPEVQLRSAQQLHVEFVEDLAACDRVIFVDAAVDGPEISLKRIETEALDYVSSSHHMTPEMILDLTRKLHGRCPEAWLCRIRGEDFEFKDELSFAVEKRMDKAIRMIRAIAVEEHHHA